jgi:hypothetical protein
MKQTNLLFILFLLLSFQGASAQVREYTLRLNTEGCEGSVYINIGEPSALEEIELSSAVYPNPVTDYLNVPVPSGKDATVFLADFSGKLLQYQNVSGDVSLCQFSLANYPAGIYFVRVAGAKNTVYKVIKN